jgi:hypothetical protein
MTMKVGAALATGSIPVIDSPRHELPSEGGEYRGEKPQVFPLLSRDCCVRARRTADPSAALGMTREEWLLT